MAIFVPPIAELTAPADWRVLDLLSDVHLQPAEPASFDAWSAAVSRSDADALFILGDLFEAWVGDDALDPSKGDLSALGQFEAQCAAVLQQASRQRPIFFMHGNRDFLLGKVGLAACGMTLLQDPTVLVFGGQRWLLSHGDVLCVDDAAYQQFRQMVHSPAWQQTSLQQPLAIRRAMGRQIRQASEQRKEQGLGYADVDAEAARTWLRAADAPALIHGHTHLPGEHDLGEGLRRIVMSDWDAAATPRRAEVLRLSLSDPRLQRLSAPAA